MRILYVHPFTQQLSGPDESLLALLEPLVATGDIEAHLLVPRLGPLAARYRALGVTIHEQPLTILHRGMTPEETALFAPRLLAQTARVAALIRAIRADVVHTNMEVVLEGGLAARCAGVPHIMHYRGNSLDVPKRLFDLMTFVWTAFADHVFCISEATAKVFRRRGYKSKIEVLYNPLKLSRFQQAHRSEAVRASLGAAPDQPLIVTVGRIHPRKDVETFVRACARVARAIPQARFAIVGSAESPTEYDYLSRVKALVTRQTIADRVVFAGARTDVPEIMKAADVFVLTSRHEGFGRVLAEAMAAGTAVVASREGALPELIDEPQFGLGATPEDDQDFGDQILRLLREPALRSAIGAGAAKRAEEFDARAGAERVRHRYVELARHKRNFRQKARPRAIL